MAVDPGRQPVFVSCAVIHATTDIRVTLAVVSNVVSKALFMMRLPEFKNILPEFLNWEKERFEDLSERVATTIPLSKLPP